MKTNQLYVSDRQNAVSTKNRSRRKSVSTITGTGLISVSHCGIGLTGVLGEEGGFTQTCAVSGRHSLAVNLRQPFHCVLTCRTQHRSIRASDEQRLRSLYDTVAYYKAKLSRIRHYRDWRPNYSCNMDLFSDTRWQDFFASMTPIRERNSRHVNSEF